MDNWYIGTMGFSYKDWKGVFYPSNLGAREYLAYYSRYFNVVEVDSTFYGTPRGDVVQRWASQTPPGFRFCLKAPRTITHDLVLQGAQGLMEEFVQSVSLLDKKLGAILFQFPPSFSSAYFAILADFLAKTPSGPRYAVEFRHRSWFNPELGTSAMLAERGVAWAATEYPQLPSQITVTAPFLYVRWIGQHGSYSTHSHERIDLSAQLRTWRLQIHASLEEVEAVFGFFNNDYAGYAIGTARRFIEIAGIAIENSSHPQQGRLF